jgi:hypothetical protein
VFVFSFRSSRANSCETRHSTNASEDSLNLLLFLLFCQNLIIIILNSNEILKEYHKSDDTKK